MIEIRSTQTIINLAKNDVGICYLPRFVVEKELQTGELVELDTDMKAAPISSAYGYRKNKWISPAITLSLIGCKMAPITMMQDQSAIIIQLF